MDKNTVQKIGKKRGPYLQFLHKHEHDETKKQEGARKRGAYLQYVHNDDNSGKAPRSSNYYWDKRMELLEKTQTVTDPSTYVCENNKVVASCDDFDEEEGEGGISLVGGEDVGMQQGDNEVEPEEQQKTVMSSNENNNNRVNSNVVFNDSESCEQEVFSTKETFSEANKSCFENDIIDDTDPALYENDSCSSISYSDDDDDDDDDDETLSDTDSETEPDMKDYVMTGPEHPNEIECDDRPLYDGARLTVSVSIMLILTFITRHHLTGVAVDDLIALIEAHMIIPNLCQTTMKLIRKFFSKIRGKVVFHYFCKHCSTYMGLENKECGVCKKSSTGNNYFIVIPLLYNLQSLFKYKDFMTDLDYPKSRIKKNPQNIEDIIDGEVYQKHFGKDGFLHGTTDSAKKREIHISLQCNTDGVKIFKSSKVEIWPIYYTINELNPSLRYQRKYRLFAGLWFSDKKPDFKTFLKPFVKELKEFALHGRSIMTEKGEKLVKVFLLSGIFDAPAKSMFQNIIQFNGLYGCSYCLEPGKTYKTSAKGHVHIFPFNFETKTGHAPLRSHSETLKHAKKAQDDVVKTGVVSSHYGIKGITWSMSIPCFDVINGLGLDYLHNTLLGVVKMLMTLWFDKKYKQMPWYIGDSVAKIDLRIKNLRLPNLISRVPRNIQNDFKHFKGSEFRNFLLFYSAPILYDFLPDEFFQNYILLVEAVFLLLKSSISPEDLRNGDKMLKHFCVRIARLYGERYQTYNAHNILHMTLTVKQHGPLWAQSAFWYEDYNGDYKHLFHGTQSVNIQIVTNTIVQHKIPEIVRSLAPGSVGYTLYNKMTVRYHQHVQTLGNCISPGIYCVGKQLKANCCPVVNSLINHLFQFAKDMYTFKRICFHGNVIQSQSYQRVFKRNTFTVKYKSRFGISYGFIKYYLNLTSSCQETDSVFVRHYLAVIEVPTILEFNMSDDSIAKLQHMVPVSFKDTTYDVCPIENIMDICCFVSTGYERDYIVEFPNRIERD